MPTPFDLLSEKLDDQADPDDQLRLQLGQNQGANLAGGPAGPPPSPNVPGPLAALAPRPVPGKPHIKLKSKSPPKKIKPRIKLKSAPSSALQDFLSTIGNTSGQ
jgi:hypothetical protein